MSVDDMTALAKITSTRTNLKGNKLTENKCRPLRGSVPTQDILVPNSEDSCL